MELRKRLTRAALGIIVGAVVGWFLSDAVLSALVAPITLSGKQDDRLASINFGSVSGAFDVRFQVALVVGIVISSPVWLYQIFAFFTPAFTRQEKKYVFGFFFTAVPLFLAGCVAGWLLIPHIVSLMMSFAISDSSTLIDAKTYLDFVMRLILVVGVAFVLPVFLVILNFMGLITSKSILKSWRFAIIVITLFTALATPAADVLSMFLLAIPLIALYFASVGVTWFHDRRVAAREQAFLNAEQ